MYIKDILKKGKPSVSFEIFPPKESSGLSSVMDTVEKLSASSPCFMSVTYGAGGGTSKNTVKIASHIQNELNTPALAHLTCVSSTKDEVSQILKELKKEGIINILALRGDLPDDDSFEFPNPLHYNYASDLIAQIKAEGGFCIGAACYPEGHPDCPSFEQDIINLKHKVDTGCDFLTTQMFFDNSLFYDFMDRITAKNINVPVLAGIMPVINAKQIKRICALSGTSLSNKFIKMVEKFEDNPEAMKQAGIAYATEQIIDLLSNGVLGIHIYTMNKPEIASSIKQNISLLL